KITIKTGTEGSAAETTYIQHVPVAPAVAPQQVQQPAQEVPAPPAPAPENPSSDNDKYITIKAPIIGTFYRKPSPDKSAFVEVGSTTKQGDVLCVIEAMKLFNEIESEVCGKIIKVLVDDSSPVEFDQPLF